AARQFLAIAYFASLVTASDLAGLTALYLLRESFKLLIFLKFLIICHALPHAYGFAITSLQVVYLPALLLLRAGLYTLFKKYPFLF
ncbi:MAG: hypothetical protein IKA22_03970, partial [Lentisphaeria bacterium]|nr:hypothetical protein [Lentisphaeria bacterium]